MDVVVRWIVTGSVIAVVIYMLVNAFRFGGSGAWPVTTGTVEGEAEIRKRNRDYYGTVRYSYVAGGEHYSGEWLTDPFFKRAQLTTFVSIHFPPGQSVTVRYHPSKLDRSMLEVDPEIYNRDPMIKLGI
jgi:uncharacterized protein DUF3592